MATWWKWLVVMAPVALLACSGTAEPQKGGDDDDNGGDGADGPGDDDDDDDVTSGETARDSYTTTPGYEPFEPAAVGFELDAVVLLDQSLYGYNIDGYGYQPPTLLLTFTSIEYFSAEDEYEQAAESCIAFGEFLFPISLAKPDQIPLQGATVLYASYDGAVNLEYTNCAGRVTPETWGADAEYMLGAFHAAHVGIGFGPMTQYLTDAWSEDTITEIGDAMVAEYIAINDLDGNFVGQDWTTAIAFEYDDATETLVSDADGYLVKVPVDDLADGDDLPQAYYRSFSYWYQDFPYMDLTNLQDGAPAFP